MFANKKQLRALSRVLRELRSNREQGCLQKCVLEKLIVKFNLKDLVTVWKLGGKETQIKGIIEILGENVKIILGV